MSPFLESETYARGRRLVFVPIAMVFLVVPYGSMLAGGPGDALRWIAAMTSIAICAWLLGLGLTVPRRRVTIDGNDRTITVSKTAPPPALKHLTASRTFDDVVSMTIDEVGPRKTDLHGYQVVITFKDGPALELQRHGNSDYAQDTIDHLVRLGLPGHSRAAAREAIASSPQPTTWL